MQFNFYKFSRYKGFCTFIIILSTLSMLVFFYATVFHSNDTNNSSNENVMTFNNVTEKTSNSQRWSNKTEYDADENPATVPHVVYEGSYEGIYEVAATHDSYSSIVNVQKAEELLKNTVSQDVAFDLYAEWYDADKQLKHYLFRQKYGVMPIYNSMVEILVDQWGNWKSIDGTYVILSGTLIIREWETGENDGDEIGIVIMENNKTASAYQKDGEYIDCKSGEKLAIGELKTQPARSANENLTEDDIEDDLLDEDF